MSVGGRLMAIGRIGRDRERRTAPQTPETEQAPHQPGKLRIPRHRRHLVLPEIGEARGQLVEVGGV